MAAKKKPEAPKPAKSTLDVFGNPTRSEQLRQQRELLDLVAKRKLE